MKPKLKDASELEDNQAGLTMWGKAGELPKGFELLTQPPLVNLKDMPLGALLDFTLDDVAPSARKDISTPNLIGRLSSDPTVRIAVPAQAAIAQVLLPGWDKDADEPARKFCSYLGRRIILRKTGFKNSAKWKKKFAIYDVAVQSA